jgi:hypothetical protein
MMLPRGEVSIRVADARLLAPLPVRRVRLLGPLEDWREALEAVGLEIVDGDREADLVVTMPRHARTASGLGAPTVLVLGPRRRALRRAGYSTRTLLVRPGAAGPRLFVPVDAPAAARHALLSRIPGRTLPKRVAIRLTLAALRAGLPLRGGMTLATRGPKTPRLVTAAVGSLLRGPLQWYLLTGEGDDLQRVVWFCFGESGSGNEPELIVKCSRVPGNEAPFDRDERALQGLEILPAPLRRRAPTLAGRLQVDGLPVAVETAAPGQPLHVVLPGARLEDATGMIDRIASWVVDVAAATSLPSTDLRAELRRLDTSVVPQWSGKGAPRGLAAALPPLPAVLQHNDLGCWNVLVRGEDFTVVDWESSRRAGLPLWDLVYFLTDALTALSDRADGRSKEHVVAALLRGELPLSTALFTRVAEGAGQLGVPLTAVGPVVTLAWLHHGLSADARARTGAAHGATTGAASATGPLQRVASYWLSDPALGVGWQAFAASHDA